MQHAVIWVSDIALAAGQGRSEVAGNFWFQRIVREALKLVIYIVVLFRGCQDMANVEA